MASDENKSVPQTRLSPEDVWVDQVIELAHDEQLALWQALEAPATLTKSQRKLAQIMRGQA